MKGVGEAATYVSAVLLCACMHVCSNTGLTILAYKLLFFFFSAKVETLPKITNNLKK